MSAKAPYLHYLNTIRKGLNRADWFLGTGALLALLALLLLSPSVTNQYRAPLQHRISDTELISRAESWLQNQHLPHSGYFRGLSVHSRTEEYNALIRHYSAAAVDEACRNQPEIMIPLIHAQIIFTPDDAGHHSLSSIITDFREGFRDGYEGESLNEDVAISISPVDLRYQLHVSLQGELFQFERQGRQRYSITELHSEALQAGFGAQWPASSPPEPHQIKFASGMQPSDLKSGASDQENNQLNPSPLPAATSDTIRHIITGPHLRRIIDYHLSETRWKYDYFNIESISIQQHQDLEIARISMVSHEQILGRTTTLEIAVDQLGHVHLIQPSYTVIDRSTAPAVNARDGITMASIVVLTIIVLILMFRRTVRRLIDIRMSKPEALVAGIASAVYFVTGYFSRSIELGYWSLNLGDIGGLVFGALFMLLGGWVFILILSAYGSSVSQEVWPTRLRDLNLLRRGYWLNQPVGQALFRSVILGAILTALTVLLILILPVKGLQLSQGAVFMSHKSYAGSLYQVSLYVVNTMIFTYIALLAVAALVWKRTRNKWVTAVTIGIFWVLLNTVPVNALPAQTDLILNGISGLLIGLIFWHYGLATTFFTVIMHRILLVASGGLAIPFNPDFWQLLLMLAVPAAGLVIGLAGLATGRTMLQLPDIIPGYLIEMANRERMERELEISRHVQQQFLPLSTPQIEGYQMLAACHPASEVGGDYYEFLPTPDGRLALAIGDVSGKGFKAAFYMTLIKGFTQSLAEQETDPSRFLTRVNQLFYRNAERGTFVSMIFGYLNLKEKELSFARAGHNPAIWYHATEGKAELIRAGGMALGLVNDERFEASLTVQKASLQSGDIIVLYTDGYTEAMNRNGELYGEERFRRAIERYAALSLNEMVTMLDDDVQRFTGGHQQSDDMTILAIKVNGE